ncbi:hypothetical protein C8F04DRAFT_1327388 [Mycena alexandri]|uniref:Uncharacterized protein n=1 Tax=Mycena alexandri TaxID=1745969 RepID=A0AAD6S1G4_9AGAR|nr:hypothetical protein C8F04DRAFT_1327388 [Mycena alexandri]
MTSQFPPRPYNSDLPTLQLEDYGGVIDSKASWGDTVAITPRFRVVNLGHRTRLSTGLKVYTTTGALSVQVFLSTNYGPTHDESGDVVVRARCYLGGPAAITLLIPEAFVDIPISEYRNPTVVGEYDTAFIRSPSNLHYTLPEHYDGGVEEPELELTSRIRSRSPSFDDIRYLRRLREIHETPFIEFRAPPYTSYPEGINEVESNDERQETTVRYSMAFSHSSPIFEGITPYNIISHSDPTIPATTLLQQPPYQMVDLRHLHDVMPGTMAEYVRLRDDFPNTPRALLGLSPELVATHDATDMPSRHLVLKHQYPGAFKPGQRFYAHGTIGGEWELGDIKGEFGRKVYVEWIERSKRLLAVVEMDRCNIYRSKRERVVTMWKNICTYIR